MSLKRALESLGIEILETEELDDEVLRIVESAEAVSLTSLDEDDTIMGIPLNLDEACSIEFDKHMDAIVPDEIQSVEESNNIAQENKREYDRRYKEMPRDRIKFSK